MKVLASLKEQDIDWSLSPEDAVMMYLEQDESVAALLPAVLEQKDASRYFVVDMWDDPPMIRLLERSMLYVNEITAFPMPEELIAGFQQYTGNRKALYAPSEPVIAWLKKLVLP